MSSELKKMVVEVQEVEVRGVVKSYRGGYNLLTYVDDGELAVWVRFKENMGKPKKGDKLEIIVPKVVSHASNSSNL